MKKLLLLILPFILLINLILVLHLNNEKEFKSDPCYVYLLNGLNLAYFHGNVSFSDHPGTPAIVFSSVIIKLAYKIKKTANDLPTDVLLYPQYYLRIIAWTFALINIFLIISIGFIIYKLTGELIYGLLFQSIPFFSKTPLVYSFYNVSPEPILFGGAILLLIAFLAKYYFNKSFGLLNLKYINNKNEMIIFSLDASVILFGIIIGFCFATKINSIPLILLPLLFISNYKNKFVFLFITLIFFVIFTLPITQYYMRFFNWITNIFLHSDIYGSGTTEIINVKILVSNLILFIRAERILFITFLISLVIILKLVVEKKYDIHFKILSIFLLVQIFDLIMVLKHFSVRYFIPIIPTIAVNLFLILQIINLSRKKKILIIIPFIVLCYIWSNNLRNDLRNDIFTSYQAVNQAEGINIYAHGCNTSIWALKFGNIHAGNQYSSLLEKLYGKQYFYHVYTQEFSDWKEQINLDTLKKMNKNVFLYGDKYHLNMYKLPFRTIKITEGKYLIETEQ